MFIDFDLMKVDKSKLEALGMCYLRRILIIPSTEKATDEELLTRERKRMMLLKQLWKGEVTGHYQRLPICCDMLLPFLRD